MRMLYVDSSMGVSVGMLAGALLELHPSPERFVEELNGLGMSNVTFSMEKRIASGVPGTCLVVNYIQSKKIACDCTECEYGDLNAVKEILSNRSLSQKVKQDVIAVYQQIVDAESHVYGIPASDVCLHEMQIAESIFVVMAVCLLIDQLSPTQIVSSTICVGGGSVHCGDDVLPVPTPVTSHILRNVPICGCQSRGELCTPIGAALLKHFVTEFADMPVMRVSQIGYGVANQSEQPNFIRLMLGETENQSQEVIELSCNVDDMTGESVGFALEQLLNAGALEVYTVPIGMKKSRPGIKFCVLCRQQEKETMVALMLRHTTTLGVRETCLKRYTLNRELKKIQTPYGVVRRKDSTGYGVCRSKYEYEDLAEIARKENLSIAEVLEIVKNS